MKRTANLNRFRSKPLGLEGLRCAGALFPFYYIFFCLGSRQRTANERVTDRAGCVHPGFRKATGKVRR